MRRACALSILATAVALWSIGCGGRGLGAHNPDDPDATPPLRDASLSPDASDQQTCHPQDAQSGNTACGLLMGYAWNGTDCQPILCTCEGSDCDEIFPTYWECMTDYAPRCLPASDCANLGLPECEQSDRCQVVWYGGGCIDVQTCSTNGSPDGMLCWEQGYACVPAGHPCNERSQGECDGECYWVGFEHELCFTEECCVTERYGYCHGYLPPDCEAQTITGCMDPCASVAGYYWDGQFCRPIICCCEGPDCGETYQTVEQCMNERQPCAQNSCAEASGYCDYGDFVVPTCVDGHGRDDYITNVNPGVCGLGVCCTPCPDESTPGVTYFGHSPQECADIDWGCYANTRSFDNECGCGCIPL